MFDIEQGAGETTNLADDPTCTEIKLALKERITTFFAGHINEHINEHADLWRGGAPRQNTERLAFGQDVWGEQWSPVYAYNETDTVENHSQT